MSALSKEMNINVGKNIKARMASRGLSQRELSTLLGMSYSMVTKTIQSNRMPSVETLEKIAKVLGCQVGELFTKFSV